MPTKTKLTLKALSQDNETSSEFGLLKPKSRIYNPGALFPRIEI